MEYVAGIREAGTQPEKHGNKCNENHSESDRDQSAQSQIDDFLLCIPAAFRLKEFSFAHPGNDHPECGIHGADIDRVRALWNPGEWSEFLPDEFNENSQTTPTGICSDPG